MFHPISEFFVRGKIKYRYSVSFSFQSLHPRSRTPRPNPNLAARAVPTREVPWSVAPASTTTTPSAEPWRTRTSAAAAEASSRLRCNPAKAKVAGESPSRSTLPPWESAVWIWLKKTGFLGVAGRRIASRKRRRLFTTGGDGWEEFKTTKIGG